MACSISAANEQQREILFLRHKLQKGLLTRDKEPEASEMKQMSEYIVKLEGYADLEVSIMRKTKINKVLKGILKLDAIPREEEFSFKDRSNVLLAKWNKILEGDSESHSATNGKANGEIKAEAAEAAAKPAPKDTNTGDNATEPEQSEDAVAEKKEDKEEEVESTESKGPAEPTDEAETAVVSLFVSSVIDHPSVSNCT